MPGLDPAIHVFLSAVSKDVDARVKPGHDEYPHSPVGALWMSAMLP
jgi:hypothetical protein